MPLPSAVRSTPVSLLLAAVVTTGCSSGGDPCEEGPFGGATCTIDGEIVGGDTLLFAGDVTFYAALAQYGLGPGLPFSVLWTVSDATVLEVETRPDWTASVTAVDTGTSWVIALINDRQVDSVFVTVVLHGATRWRSTFAGVPVGAYPAIGIDSIVRIVTGGAAPLLRLVAPESGEGTSVASCFSMLGPSLGDADVAFASGTQCTRRHAQNGDPVWTAPVGSAALGIAVASDGGAITLSGDSLHRLSVSGDLVWGQHLRGTPQTAPVIGPGGDVYVGWRAGGADSVTRFGIDSTPRWSVAVPGLSIGTPAVLGGRLYFGRPGGLFALDSSGAVAWDRAFSAASPGASATSRTSSPVHDGLVIFVQNEEALYSYVTDGSFLWAADSLGYGATTGAVGAPVLLSDLSVLVPCVSVAGGREVCAVRQVDGRLSWRSALGGGSVDGVAVGRDGAIYATRSLTGGSSELVALWGRVAPSITGWPTEGGDPQRTRRR
jgi:hypothetical protein